MKTYIMAAEIPKAIERPVAVVFALAARPDASACVTEVLAPCTDVMVSPSFLTCVSAAPARLELSVCGSTWADSSAPGDCCAAVARLFPLPAVVTLDVTGPEYSAAASHSF
jgi:hypothetical protein